MKKLSKIFAVVLCLTLVLALLPMGASAANEKCVEFTVDTLGLPEKSYTANATTVDGVAVEWIQLGNYGNGIQMRDKDGKTSMFWSAAALPGGITKIEFTYNDAKKCYGDNNMIVNFGTEVKGADCANTLVTVEGTKSYEIIPDATNYTHFYIEWDTGYSSYWDSIKVYYNEGAGDVEPEVTAKYYVAGVSELCGSYWKENDEANIMTTDDDMLYSKVYENVPAGSYELKVTDGTWDNSWGDNGNNYTFTVDAVSTVTVVFNAKTEIVSVEVVPNETEPADPSISDISAALAAEEGEFTVKGIVTCIDGKNLYVQDATGAICARMNETPKDVALGDIIIATGSKSVYNGLPQLGSGTYEKVEAGKLSAKEVTIDGLTAADICTYIKLFGVTVTEIFDNNGAYSAPNVTVTDGTNEIQIYKAVVAKNEDGTWAISVGDKIDVYAAVSCFHEKLQLRNSSADEITIAGEEPAPEVNYYVTGNADWLSGWKEFNESGLMAKGEDGLYSKVYENVPAGSYELKVNIGNWSESWGHNGNNYTFTVEAVSTVTVIFNAETKEVSVEVVPNETEPADPSISDISAALAAEEGEFTVKGIVTCIDGKNIYVQDATGAICVRMNETPKDVALGDIIIGTGSKSVYNGLPQLGSGTYEKVEAGKLSAKEVTIDGLTAADICTYIKLSGVTVTEVFDNNGAYSAPNVTVTDGTNEIQIYKAVVAKNEDGAWTIKVGDKIDVYAAVSCFHEKLQLRNSSADEITVVVDENPGEQLPETGDMSIAGLVVAMMAATAGVVVISKKKEF